jgi:starch synthase
LILGTGEEKYHFLLEELQRRYRSKLKVYIGFDEILAHKLYAAADMILIPSLYEPCGLVQFIALRYATIPIGHKVGGLKDTISEFDPLLGKGEGFLFSPYEKENFLDAIKKALYIYKHKSDWQKVQYNALKKDFSWYNSAKKYNLLYKKVSSLSWEH